MTRKRFVFVAAMVAAAVAGGIAGSELGGARPVSAQVVTASTLPPIFQVGSTVTFGPQGPDLDVLQIHGEWIFVAQHSRLSAGTTVEPPSESNRFWLYVPRVAESWREVAK